MPKISVPNLLGNYYEWKEDMAKKRKTVQEDCTKVTSVADCSIPPLESSETSGTKGGNYNDSQVMHIFMRAQM